MNSAKGATIKKTARGVGSSCVTDFRAVKQVLFTGVMIFILLSANIAFSSNETSYSLPSEICKPGAKSYESSPPHRVGLLLFDAQEYLKKRQYSKAVTVLQRYIKNYPDRDHGLLEFTLGNALYLSGKKKEALESYLAAVRLSACYGPAWVNLGNTAYELGRYGLAADALERGFILGGEKNADMLYYAAVACIMSDQPGRAAGLLEKLVSGTYGNPSKQWLRTLLHVYIETDDNAKAEKLISRILTTYRDDPEVWKLLYSFEANRGNYQEAAVAMTIYSYLKELSREEEILLADLYASIGVPVQACKYYENAMAEGASVSEYERLAHSYFTAHEIEKARETLLKGLEKEPSARMWSMLGDILYLKEDYSGAYEAFQHSTKLNSEDGRSYLLMGYCAVQTGETEKAEDALKKASQFKKYKKTARNLMKFIQ